MAIYVRQSASGSADGSDWTNAYTSVPSTIARGETVYVADGTYSGFSLDDAEDGTTVSTLKKATIADHGTDTGWDDTYGDGEAVFGTCGVDTDYWLIDGNSEQGSYGFRIAPTGTVTYCLNGISTNEIEIRGLHIDASGVTTTSGGVGMIFTLGSFTFTNIHISDTPDDAMKIIDTTGLLLEYSHIGPRGSSDGNQHADCIAIENNSTGDVIVRHNRLDWNGQMLWISGTSTHTYQDFYVYGNLFLNTVTDSPVNSNQAIKSHQNLDPGDVGAMWVFNNSFVGIYQAHTENGDGTGAYYNNMYFDLTIETVSFSGTHSHNWYQTGYTYPTEATAQEGGDPFTDYDNGDFTLVEDTDAGFTLGSPYDEDLLGNARGGNGTWTRGAYEFGSEAPSEELGRAVLLVV